MGLMPQQAYGHPAAPPSVLPHGMPPHVSVGEVTPTGDVNVAMQWQRQHAVSLLPCSRHVADMLSVFTVMGFGCACKHMFNTCKEGHLSAIMDKQVLTIKYH